MANEVLPRGKRIQDRSHHFRNAANTRTVGGSRPDKYEAKRKAAHERQSTYDLLTTQQKIDLQMERGFNYGKQWDKLQLKLKAEKELKNNITTSPNAPAKERTERVTRQSKNK